MSLISIDKITTGMKLAKPLVNKYNQILLPAGTVLEDKHREVLEKWNIQTLEIQSEETIDENIPEEIIEMALKKIKEKILWQPRNHIEQEIIDIALITIAKKLLKTNKGNQ